MVDERDVPNEILRQCDRIFDQRFDQHKADNQLVLHMNQQLNAHPAESLIPSAKRFPRVLELIDILPASPGSAPSR